MRAPIDALHPNDWNPNVVPEHIQDALETNIDRAGFNQPVLVRPHPDLPGEHQIIDGEHRWLAAKAQGAEEIEVIVRDFSDVEARAQTLAMNHLRGQMEAADVARLIRELDELELPREELADFTGYTLTEFDEFDAALNLADLLNRQPDWDDAFGKVAAEGGKLFRQIAFVLLEEQAHEVLRAVDAAKKMGPFDSDNPNGNGNAISRICETFLSLEQ